MEPPEIQNSAESLREGTPIAGGRKVPCASCKYDLRGRCLGELCPECGTPIVQAPIADQGAGNAVAAMVLGMVSIMTCMFYGVPALVCGPLAMTQAKKARLAVQAGTCPTSVLPMANAGRVCGIVGMALGAAFILFMVAYILFITVFIVGAGTFVAPAAPPAPMPTPFGP